MTEGKLAARRGREVRRAARAQGDLVKLGAIHRRIPAVELLHSEAVDIIEHNAETILEEIGIEFRRDPPSLQLWRDAGAAHEVDQESSKLSAYWATLSVSSHLLARPVSVSNAQNSVTVLRSRICIGFDTR